MYIALNEDGVFIFDVHSTYQADEEFYQAIPTMKMRILPCFRFTYEVELSLHRA